MRQLRQIAHRVESLVAVEDGKRAVQDLGFSSCAHAIDLKHVPFYEPCDHYLTTVVNPRLPSPDEILLLLATKDATLLSYSLQKASWGQRVRALIAADLAHAWNLKQVCDRLATTESTLRRDLKQEEVSFRALIQELRLSIPVRRPMPVHGSSDSLPIRQANSFALALSHYPRVL